MKSTMIRRMDDKLGRSKDGPPPWSASKGFDLSNVERKTEPKTEPKPKTKAKDPKPKTEKSKPKKRKRAF